MAAVWTAMSLQRRDANPNSLSQSLGSLISPGVPHEDYSTVVLHSNMVANMDVTDSHDSSHVHRQQSAPVPRFQKLVTDSSSSITFLGKRITREYHSTFMLPDKQQVAVNRRETTIPEKAIAEVTLSLSTAAPSERRDFGTKRHTRERVIHYLDDEDDWKSAILTSSGSRDAELLGYMNSRYARSIQQTDRVERSASRQRRREVVRAREIFSDEEGDDEPIQFSSDEELPPLQPLADPMVNRRQNVVSPPHTISPEPKLPERMYKVTTMLDRQSLPQSPIIAHSEKPGIRQVPVSNLKTKERFKELVRRWDERAELKQSSLDQDVSLAQPYSSRDSLLSGLEGHRGSMVTSILPTGTNRSSRVTSPIGFRKEADLPPISPNRMRSPPAYRPHWGAHNRPVSSSNLRQMVSPAPSEPSTDRSEKDTRFVYNHTRLTLGQERFGRLDPQQQGSIYRPPFTPRTQSVPRALTHHKPALHIPIHAGKRTVGSIEPVSNTSSCIIFHKSRSLDRYEGSHRTFDAHIVVKEKPDYIYRSTLSRLPIGVSKIASSPRPNQTTDTSVLKLTKRLTIPVDTTSSTGESHRAFTLPRDWQKTTSTSWSESCERTSVVETERVFQSYYRQERDEINRTVWRRTLSLEPGPVRETRHPQAEHDIVVTSDGYSDLNSPQTRYERPHSQPDLGQRSDDPGLWSPTSPQSGMDDFHRQGYPAPQRSRSPIYDGTSAHSGGVDNDQDRDEVTQHKLHRHIPAIDRKESFARSAPRAKSSPSEVYSRTKLPIDEQSPERFVASHRFERDWEKMKQEEHDQQSQHVKQFPDYYRSRIPSSGDHLLAPTPYKARFLKSSTIERHVQSKSNPRSAQSERPFRLPWEFELDNSPRRELRTVRRSNSALERSLERGDSGKSRGRVTRSKSDREHVEASFDQAYRDELSRRAGELRKIRDPLKRGSSSDLSELASQEERQYQVKGGSGRSIGRKHPINSPHDVQSKPSGSAADRGSPLTTTSPKRHQILLRTHIGESPIDENMKRKGSDKSPDLSPKRAMGQFSRDSWNLEETHPGGKYRDGIQSKQLEPGIHHTKYSPKRFQKAPSAPVGEVSLEEHAEDRSPVRNRRRSPDFLLDRPITKEIDDYVIGREGKPSSGALSKPFGDPTTPKSRKMLPRTPVDDEPIRHQNRRDRDSMYEHETESPNDFFLNDSWNRSEARRADVPSEGQSDDARLEISRERFGKQLIHKGSKSMAQDMTLNQGDMTISKSSPSGRDMGAPIKEGPKSGPRIETGVEGRHPDETSHGISSLEQPSSRDRVPGGGKSDWNYSETMNQRPEQKNDEASSFDRRASNKQRQLSPKRIDSTGKGEGVGSYGHDPSKAFELEKYKPSQSDPDKMFEKRRSSRDHRETAITTGVSSRVLPRETTIRMDDRTGEKQSPVGFEGRDSHALDKNKPVETKRGNRNSRKTIDDGDRQAFGVIERMASSERHSEPESKQAKSRKPEHRESRLNEEDEEPNRKYAGEWVPLGHATPRSSSYGPRKPSEITEHKRRTWQEDTPQEGDTGRVPAQKRESLRRGSIKSGDMDDYAAGSDTLLHELHRRRSQERHPDPSGSDGAHSPSATRPHRRVFDKDQDRDDEQWEGDAGKGSAKKRGSLKRGDANDDNAAESGALPHELHRLRSGEVRHIPSEHGGGHSPSATRPHRRVFDKNQDRDDKQWGGDAGKGPAQKRESPKRGSIKRGDENDDYAAEPGALPHELHRLRSRDVRHIPSEHSSGHSPSATRPHRRVLDRDQDRDDKQWEGDAGKGSAKKGGSLKRGSIKRGDMDDDAAGPDPLLHELHRRRSQERHPGPSGYDGEHSPSATRPHRRVFDKNQDRDDEQWEGDAGKGSAKKRGSIKRGDANDDYAAESGALPHQLHRLRDGEPRHIPSEHGGGHSQSATRPHRRVLDKDQDRDDKQWEDDEGKGTAQKRESPKRGSIKRGDENDDYAAEPGALPHELHRLRAGEPRHIPSEHGGGHSQSATRPHRRVFDKDQDRDDKQWEGGEGKGSAQKRGSPKRGSIKRGDENDDYAAEPGALSHELHRLRAGEPRHIPSEHGVGHSQSATRPHRRVFDKDQHGDDEQWEGGEGKGSAQKRGSLKRGSGEPRYDPSGHGDGHSPSALKPHRRASNRNRGGDNDRELDLDHEILRQKSDENATIKTDPKQRRPLVSEDNEKGRKGTHRFRGEADEHPSHKIIQNRESGSTHDRKAPKEFGGEQYERIPTSPSKTDEPKDLDESPGKSSIKDKLRQFVKRTGSHATKSKSPTKQDDKSSDLEGAADNQAKHRGSRLESLSPKKLWNRRKTPEPENIDFPFGSSNVRPTEKINVKRGSLPRMNDEPGEKQSKWTRPFDENGSGRSTEQTPKLPMRDNEDDPPKGKKLLHSNRDRAHDTMPFPTDGNSHPKRFKMPPTKDQSARSGSAEGKLDPTPPLSKNKRDSLNQRLANELEIRRDNHQRKERDQPPHTEIGKPERRNSEHLSHSRRGSDAASRDTHGDHANKSKHPASSPQIERDQLRDAKKRSSLPKRTIETNLPTDYDDDESGKRGSHRGKLGSEKSRTERPYDHDKQSIDRLKRDKERYSSDRVPSIPDSIGTSAGRSHDRVKDLEPRDTAPYDKRKQKRPDGKQNKDAHDPYRGVDDNGGGGGLDFAHDDRLHGTTDQDPTSRPPGRKRHPPPPTSPPAHHGGQRRSPTTPKPPSPSTAYAGEYGLDEDGLPFDMGRTGNVDVVADSSLGRGSKSGARKRHPPPPTSPPSHHGRQSPMDQYQPGSRIPYREGIDRNGVSGNLITEVPGDQVNSEYPSDPRYHAYRGRNGQPGLDERGSKNGHTPSHPDEYNLLDEAHRQRTSSRERDASLDHYASRTPEGIRRTSPYPSDEGRDERQAKYDKSRRSKPDAKKRPSTKQTTPNSRRPINGNDENGDFDYVNLPYRAVTGAQPLPEISDRSNEQNSYDPRVGSGLPDLPPVSSVLGRRGRGQNKDDAPTASTRPTASPRNHKMDRHVKGTSKEDTKGHGTADREPPIDVRRQDDLDDDDDNDDDDLEDTDEDLRPPALEVIPQNRRSAEPMGGGASKVTSKVRLYHPPRGPGTSPRGSLLSPAGLSAPSIPGAGLHQGGGHNKTRYKPEQFHVTEADDQYERTSRPRTKRDTATSNREQLAGGKHSLIISTKRRTLSGVTGVNPLKARSSSMNALWFSNHPVPASNQSGLASPDGKNLRLSTVQLQAQAELERRHRSSSRTLSLDRQSAAGTESRYGSHSIQQYSGIGYGYDTRGRLIHGGANLNERAASRKRRLRDGHENLSRVWIPAREDVSPTRVQTEVSAGAPGYGEERKANLDEAAVAFALRDFNCPRARKTGSVREASSDENTSNAEEHIYARPDSIRARHTLPDGYGRHSTNKTSNYATLKKDRTQPRGVRLRRPRLVPDQWGSVPLPSADQFDSLLRLSASSIDSRSTTRRSDGTRRKLDYMLESNV